MRRSRLWIGVLLAQIVAVGCSDDDGGEGEPDVCAVEQARAKDAILDIVASAAEGVFGGVQSIRVFYLMPGVTSCQGLNTGRVDPGEFCNRIDPKLEVWSGEGAPRVAAQIPNGSSLVFVELWETEDASDEQPHAVGCEEDVYVGPDDSSAATIQVHLNP